MADRIERYLGRLEAELEGRVEAEQLEAVLLEVECHLRESEEAYIELGEPDELANRLAVDGFGGVEEICSIGKKSREPLKYSITEFNASWLFVGLMVACTSIYYFSVSSGLLYSGYEPVIFLSFFPLVLLAHHAGKRRWKAAWMAVGLFVVLTSVGAWAGEELLNERIPYKLLERTDFALVFGSYFFLPVLVSVLLTQAVEVVNRLIERVRGLIYG